MDYKEAKRLAGDNDPKVRRSVASRTDVKPEILFFLAEDPSPEVRRTLAANLSVPGMADLVLAQDSDEDVRTGLVGKISRMAPDLGIGERGRLQDAAEEALSILARDQITRVRQVLSEALKDVAHAPPEVINALARDSQAVVACPVLKFSPVLTDADLLDIIAYGPARGGLGAISSRVSVSQNLSAAIGSTNDIDAIGKLLANANAQIREETLDDLIDRAPAHELWHAPLARRPRLSPPAAGRMAIFLADNLLDALSSRDDLDGETIKAVKEVVRHRLGDKAKSTGYEVGHRMDFLRISPPVDMVKALDETGRLGQDVILKALHAGDFGFILAALMVRSGLPLEVTRRIFANQSAKGIVSLVWKAGMPMNLALLLQQRMGRVPPKDILGDSSKMAFPLNEDEMKWQLEFFNGHGN
ncbi:MAG TPA: DUF2336 domain-containing protein [Alphaproteobacteria bacterium]|nr:DUF2336 domain-containing protein [Alphaproteobacteria bacterium]